jgi:hypothetical protein
MSIATEIQRLQNAKADIKTAIEEKGVEVGDGLIDTYAEKIAEISSGSDVIDFARYAKNFQFGTDDGLPEEITVNFDYSTDISTFWAGVINKNVKHITLNMKKQAKNIYRAFDQVSGAVGDILEHITYNVDTSAITTFKQCFYTMRKLKIIDGKPIDFSSATSISWTWCNGCNVLEEVRVVKESIKVNITVDIKNASDETIQSFVDGLADLTGQTAQTVTWHANIGQKLTEEQKANIFSKNWTSVY